MKQLLVVATDPNVAETIETALLDLPCDHICAPDAASALEILKTRRVDVVFLDLNCLGRDGLQLLQALRSRGNPVPVFVLPTNRVEEMAQLREAAGRGVYYETIRMPVAQADIRAATTAAFSA